MHPRVLVDKIYRIRANRVYCEARDIEMPGRPHKHPDPAKKKVVIEAENAAVPLSARFPT